MHLTLSPPQAKPTGCKEHPHSLPCGSCLGRERALLLPHQLHTRHRNSEKFTVCLLTFFLHILYMCPHLLCDSLTLHFKDPPLLPPLLQLPEQSSALSNAARMWKMTQHNIHLPVVLTVPIVIHSTLVQTVVGLKVFAKLLEPLDHFG